MTIEDKNKFFTPLKAEVKFDYVRFTENAELKLSVIMHRAINGQTHPFRIKRQLAVTRKYCKTVVG